MPKNAGSSRTGGKSKQTRMGSVGGKGQGVAEPHTTRKTGANITNPKRGRSAKG